MISLEEVLHLHKNSLRDFGGRPGIRDINLLKSSIARPFQTFDNVELYPSTFEKAAAILHSIIKNHPFIDGNKRTGFLAAFTLLFRSDIELTASEKDAYNFAFNLASSQIPFDQIVSWLYKNSQSITKKNE